MSDRKIILFGNKTLGIYKLSNIFNPDVDGTDPTAAGKIVPALYSQVIDDINGKKNKLYTVIAVDETTYKSTLIPSSFIANTDNEERVVSYGNDIYMLYYIEASGRLIIDNKLTFFGEHGVKYQLVRVNSDGTTTVINKYATDPSGGGIPITETIDLEVSEISGSKKCPNCYTDLTLTEGNQIYLYIYDITDTVVAMISLITKKATGILEANDNPIVGLTVDANQMDGEDIILYLNQNKNDLNFEIKVVYADATEKVISLNDIDTYVYGLETIDSRIANSTYPILFKKYLPSSDYAVNYVTCSKTVKVIASDPYGISKVSPIPIWNATTRTWTLKLLAYAADRLTAPVYITPTVSSFSGTLFDTQQNITITTTHENPSGINETYTQSFSIKFISPTKLLFDSLEYTFSGGSGVSRIWTNTSGATKTITYSNTNSRWEQRTGSVINYMSATGTAGVLSNPWDNLIWYTGTGGSAGGRTCSANATITQNPSVKNWVIGPIPNTTNIYYGDISAIFKRPKIYYGTRSGSVGSVYHIPTSVFGTSSTSKQNVLNNFYTNANPPRRSTDAFAPTPTHLTIRDNTTLGVLLSVPISIDNWNNNLAIALDNSYTGKTVIVEFLVEDAGDFNIIYGVPVEIVSVSI